MTIDDQDDPLDARLRELARDYHEPPEPPREAMWAAVAERRRRVRVLRLPRGWTLGLAAAALLVLGVALGRWSATRADDAAVASVAPENGAGLRLAATPYLSRTEALLTAFRSQGRAAPDAQFLATARDLLGMTRLLLDSPAADDAAFRALLEDLELVLAQLVRLAPDAPSPEVDLITQGLNERGVLPRLRTAIPAGPAAPAAGDL
jgi:hypothetical protein